MSTDKMLTDDEKELLRQIRNLTPRDGDIIRRCINGLAESHSEENDQQGTILYMNKTREVSR